MQRTIETQRPHQQVHGVRRIACTLSIASLILATVLLMPAGADASPRPAASCQNVETYIEGYAIPAGGVWTAFATLITGDLGGDGSSLAATLSIEKVTPGGTTWFVGSHTFVTVAYGTFSTTDTIVVTPSGHFNSTYVITDGATGTIHSHGTIDLATGFISARYHGRVCQL
jgi:hypothetical protein